MGKAYMLTTIDNPYNPFDDFNRWFEFDELCGYCCCERIAKLAKVYDGMSEDERCDAIERAIDTIIDIDFTGLFRKVDEQRAKELVDIRLHSPYFQTKLDSGIVD